MRDDRAMKNLIRIALAGAVAAGVTMLLAEKVRQARERAEWDDDDPYGPENYGDLPSLHDVHGRDSELPDAVAPLTQRAPF
jgi:hypothetical protein